MAISPNDDAYLATPSSEAVRSELEKILASVGFRNAEKLCRLLRFVLEHTLSGEADQLKEYRIGLDVFGRGPSYDPRLDPIVRLEAGRLRAKLAQYYAEEGLRDAVRIDVPKGGYSAVFTFVSDSPMLHRATEWSKQPPISRSSGGWFLSRHLRLCGTILLALVLCSSGLYWRHRSTSAKTSPPSIAVLPFLNLTGKPENEWLTDGLTDDLTDSLTKVTGLSVSARASAFRFKGSYKDMREVGSQLHVTAILEGSVHANGNRLRITTQLVRAEDGHVIWARAIEPQTWGKTMVEDEISHGVAETLGVGAFEQTKERSRLHVPDAQTRELYLLGRYYWDRRTATDEWKAINYFDEAIAQDPQYAHAYLGLAEAYAVLGGNNWAPSEQVFSRARVAAQQALLLDGDLSEAHATLALVMFLNVWDFSAAEREFKRALALNPNYATAHQWEGMLLLNERRFSEARAQLRMAQDLDPLSLMIAVDLGFVYSGSGDYDAAVSQAQKVLTSDADYAWAYSLLGLAQRNKRQYKQAVESYKKYVVLSGRDPDALKELGLTYAYAGQRDKALVILREVQRVKVVNSPFYLAALNTGLGYKHEAYRWLEAAIRQRSPACTTLNIDPAFDPLRSESRFQRLVRLVMMQR